MEHLLTAEDKHSPAPCDQCASMSSVLEDNLGRITRLACRVFNVPISAIAQLDENHQWFRAAQGLSLRSSIPREHSFAEHVVSSRETLVVADVADEKRFTQSPLVAAVPEIRFYAGVAVLMADSRSVVVLFVAGHQPRQLAGIEVRMLRDLGALAEHEMEKTVAEQARAALASELDSARREARLDPMTRLLNRQGMLTTLSHELTRSRREHFGLGLMFIDLDGFKRINDRYGHEAGDLVLREVAQGLEQVLRPYDNACRYGGDELLIVAPNVTRGALLAMAERTRHRIASLSTRYDNDEITVTASVGLAWSSPRNPAKIQTFIRTADQALYRAKSAGGDCVVLN